MAPALTNLLKTSAVQWGEPLNRMEANFALTENLLPSEILLRAPVPILYVWKKCEIMELEVDKVCIHIKYANHHIGNCFVHEK